MNMGFFTSTCLASFIDRNDEQLYVCGKWVGHRDVHKDQVHGVVWADAEHWGGPERG